MDFDILIVGAGIAGASLGAELSRTHRVAILEREEFPGYHSTGRSAALFSESYGNSAVRALSRASRDFFYTPPTGFAPAVLVRPRGALHVAQLSQMPLLNAFASRADVCGSVRRLSDKEAVDACPILRPEMVAGAVMEDIAADVDVHTLHQSYLRRFRDNGGVLKLRCEVRSLSHKGGLWCVNSASSLACAPILVNAAGAWADTLARLAGIAPLNIQPCRRTVVLIELPGNLPPDSWPMTIDIEETFYMKPDAGLLLISPADETPVPPSDAQPEELDIAIAIDRIERSTILKIDRLRRKWAGLRSFAPDRSPVIGFDARAAGFFWLAAQGGYGIQTAPAASRLAAALVRKETPRGMLGDPWLIAQLSPTRFSAKRTAETAA